jgi:hypothetical protein
MQSIVQNRVLSDHMGEVINTILVS